MGSCLPGEFLLRGGAVRELGGQGPRQREVDVAQLYFSSSLCEIPAGPMQPGAVGRVGP